MTLEIRILQSADRTILDHVAPGLFDYALDPRLVDEFLEDDRHHLVVAIDQGEVIGFASGVHYIHHIHPDKPAALWINEVSVVAGHQRRGVGQEVVRALLEHAKQLGCTEAWVATEQSNEAAIRLYASTGGKKDPDDLVMFTYFMNSEQNQPAAAE